MIPELLAAAPVVLGSAVRPPLNLLSLVVAAGGVALGGWLVWIGIDLGRPSVAPPPVPPTRTPPTESRTSTAPSRAVV